MPDKVDLKNNYQEELDFHHKVDQDVVPAKNLFLSQRSQDFSKKLNINK